MTTPVELYNDPSKVDWLKPIVVDFESYYDNEWSLKKITTEKYIRGEGWECIGVSVKVGDEPTQFYKLERGIPVIKNVLERFPNSPVISHNNSFDMAILAWRYNIHPNFMVDTAIMAKLCGLDRVAGRTSLAKLSDQLEQMGIVNTVKGKTVHDMLGVHAADMTEKQWTDYGEYCKLDSDLCYALYMYMIYRVPTLELIMADITTKMFTKPMFDFDVPLLQNYAVQLATERDKMLGAIASDLGFKSNDELLANLRSSAKFVKLLERLGVETPMKWSEKKGEFIPAVSKTDKAFLDLLDHENELVRVLVETKLGSMSSMEQTRTATFLDIASRGKAPVYLRYGSANTLRYGGGQGTNYQNLSKRTKDPVLRRSMRAMDGHIVLASDSSQIECRINSLLSNQADLVQLFLDGGDPYVDMASAIFNKPYDEIFHAAKVEGTKDGKRMRNLGKECQLADGYGMSWATFKARMELFGNMEAAEMAEELTKAYRNKNNMIVAFWRQCDRILDTLYAGGSVSFGGPNQDLFFADGSSVFHDVKIPSIRLPNGTYIWYQNLRKEAGDDGRINYVYDQFKDGRFIPKRIWGSALVENLCIAEDTEVLTDSGWKKIQDITLADKVHDGIDFVTHGGLVSKSVKPCVIVDGVYMTKDHEVLTNDGWKKAEVHLSERGTSQLSRFDFSEVWQANSHTTNTQQWEKVALGLPMRLWERCKQARVQGKNRSDKRNDTPLRVQYKGVSPKQTECSRIFKTPDLLGMAEYESQMFKPEQQGLEKLRGAWNISLQRMAGLQAIFSRYVTDLFKWVGLRPYRQQFGLLQAELSMGYTGSKLQQQAEQRSNKGWGRYADSKGIFRAFWRKENNYIVSLREGSNNATACRETQPEKKVYDILDCGPLSRFVVKGKDAPFVVHNCQSLSFAVLKWQAIEIAKAGIPVNLNVHDEWVSVVPKEKAGYAAAVHYKAMKSTPDYIPDGLLDCEVDVGLNYADLKTLDVSKFIKEQ